MSYSWKKRWKLLGSADEKTDPFVHGFPVPRAGRVLTWRKTKGTDTLTARLIMTYLLPTPYGETCSQQCYTRDQRGLTHHLHIAGSLRVDLLLRLALRL